MGIPLRATLLGETCLSHANVFVGTNKPHLLTHSPDGQILAIADPPLAPIAPNPDPAGGTFLEWNTGVVRTARPRGSLQGLYLFATAFHSEKDTAEVLRVLTDTDPNLNSYSADGIVGSASVPGSPGLAGSPSRSSFVATVSPDSATASSTSSWTTPSPSTAVSPR